MACAVFDASWQNGKPSVMLRWTCDGGRVALHADGEVSLRRYGRTGAVHDSALGTVAGDLRSHPLWRMDIEMLTMFGVKCAVLRYV